MRGPTERSSAALAALHTQRNQVAARGSRSIPPQPWLPTYPGWARAAPTRRLAHSSRQTCAFLFNARCRARVMRQCAQNSKTCSALSSGASVIAARWARAVAQAGARAHTCATHSFAPCGHGRVRTAARIQARTHACTHASLNCHACMHALDVLTCKLTHYAGTHCTRAILASCTPHARSSSNGSSRSHQTCCASDIRHNLFFPCQLHRPSTAPLPATPSGSPVVPAVSAPL